MKPENRMALMLSQGLGIPREDLCVWTYKPTSHNRQEYVVCTKEDLRPFGAEKRDDGEHWKEAGRNDQVLAHGVDDAHINIARIIRNYWEAKLNGESK